MSNMQLFVGITGDRKLSIELHMDGKPLGHIFLTPEAAKSHADVVRRYAELLEERR